MYIINIPMDDIENDHLREPHALYKYLKEKVADENQYYILLVKIQFVDCFTEVLNSLLQLDNVDIYVTGSNSKFYHQIFYLSFEEEGIEEIRMKKNKTVSTIYYLCSVAWFALAIMYFKGEDNTSMGITYLSIASVWLCLGTVYTTRQLRFFKSSHPLLFLISILPILINMLDR